MRIEPIPAQRVHLRLHDLFCVHTKSPRQFCALFLVQREIEAIYNFKQCKGRSDQFASILLNQGSNQRDSGSTI